MRPTSVKELSASRRKRDELHAMVQAMRRLVSTGGAGAPGGDASTSSPLPQLHEVVATPSRILVFFELEPLLRRDGAGRTHARARVPRADARSHARTLARSHARTLARSAALPTPPAGARVGLRPRRAASLPQAA